MERIGEIDPDAEIEWVGLKLFATDVDGTLTDGGMYYSLEGEVMKRFDTRDAFGMNLLRSAGIELAIVTAEDSPIVAARAKKLKIDRVFLGIHDKVSTLLAIFSELGNCTTTPLDQVGCPTSDIK